MSEEKQMTETELLKSTIDYYSENTDRRCSNNNGFCYYNPIKIDKQHISEGCAIGRYMTPEQKEKALDFEGTVNILPSELMPESLKHLSKSFLRRIQSLHDCSNYWNDNGLTSLGKAQVNRLIADYGLDMEAYNV